VAAAWQASRESIGRHEGAATAALAEDGFPLPGLPSLFSAIAAAEIAPDTLLADTAAGVVTLLESVE